MDQPRVPAGSSDGGQWTSPGSLRSRGATSSRGDYSAPPNVPKTVGQDGSAPTEDYNPTGEFSKKASEQLAKWENRVKDQKIESAQVISASGTVEVEKDGKKDSVFFSNDELDRMKDSVVTHNHPLGDPPSADDVNLAATNNVKEVRVCTSDGVLFRFGRTGSDWPPQTGDIALNNYEVMTTRLQNAVNSGKMSVKTANKNYDVELHQILVDIADESDGKIYYKKSQRSK